MSGGIIRVDHGEGGWAAVPLAAIGDQTLSLAARGLLTWFLTRPPGWEVRPDYCRRLFQIGEARWGGLTAELVRAGFYHRRVERDARGRVRTNILITPTAQLKQQDCSPPLVNPGPGESATRFNQLPSGSMRGQAGDLNNKEVNKKREPKEEGEITSKQQPACVFDANLELRGLLSAPERCQVQEMLANGAETTLAQAFADELAGALRARGRRGPQGIQNPVRFVSRIIDRAGIADLSYADGERELREARARAQARVGVGQLAQPSKEFVPPPPELRAALARMKAEQRGAA